MKNKGFTLVELLIVVGIIAILVVVIFVSLNPLQLFAESRNAQRWVKVSELLTAIHMYTIEQLGIVPNQTDWQDGVYYVLGTGNNCANTCGSVPVSTTCLNLTELIKSKRVNSLPTDPLSGDLKNTGFYVYREDGTIISVGSCRAELNKKIELTR